MALFSQQVSKSVSTQCDNFCRSRVFYTTIVDLLISILNPCCKVLQLNLCGSLYLSSIKYPLPFKVLFALNFVLSDINIGISVFLLMALESSFQFFYFQTFCVNFFLLMSYRWFKMYTLSIHILKQTHFLSTFCINLYLQSPSKQGEKYSIHFLTSAPSLPSTAHAATLITSCIDIFFYTSTDFFAHCFLHPTCVGVSK